MQDDLIFILGSIFINLCYENAYTKLMTLYKRSNRTDMFIDFVSTIFFHEWKYYFITHFAYT